MVYVISKNGQPLMPTRRYGKVRHLLKDGRAAVVRHCPFTIRLLYKTPDRTQPVDLGIDAGSRRAGFSACTDEREVYKEEHLLRTDVGKNLEQRRSLRRARRNRKTRYRKPRFLNRTKSKKQGWLAPSVKERCGEHVERTRKIIRILPVSGITIEMAPFDTQKLKADLREMGRPEGTDYQHGESEGFDNIKAYVKWRDGYKCRVCGREHVPLQVHHRVQRKDGGSNAPANLVTVCEDCHKAFHAGTLKGGKAEVMLPGPEVKPLSDAAFMGIMRWAVWDELKSLGIPLHMTFGYITARQRREHGIEKSHCADARCISGHPDAEPCDECFVSKKVRCHNRQIHKLTVQKGGKRRNNQTAYEVKGFRLFDKVKYKGQTCFVFGRRATGSFDVRLLDGTKVSPCAGYKKLVLLERASHTLMERRTA